MRRTIAAIAIGAAVGLSATAEGQTLIDPAHRFSWGENIGFMNWADADGGDAGVRVHEGFLSGFIWGENVGWINAGDGTPADGTAYANVDGTDFGVNVASTGELSGFAWGENLGWINFSGGAMATPPQPARIDFGANRFRGYAWGENVGWINLDDDVHYVGIQPSCACEYDGAAGVNVFDLLAFLDLWFVDGAGADIDGTPGVDVFDLLSFLDCWFPASAGAPCA
jgi:hypothetical protein